VSRANVELILGLYQAPDVDYVPLYRDETCGRSRPKPFAPFVHADFECVWYQFGSEKRYAGLDGLRDFMRDWMTPWVTYRIETEEAIDLGERVLLLNNDRGRRGGGTHEVTGRLGAIWTIRDGKIARLDAYLDRADALKAAGLEE
jgi:ketosteroid isomerase-like protein